MAEKANNEWKEKCAFTGKAIGKAKRYYRNGKYYTNKAAYKAKIKKDQESKEAK